MRIRQIVFAAAQLQDSRALLAQLFALPEPFRDPGVAEFGIDNAVFTFGDQFIEIISPTQPDTACGRHLARHGDSGYMLLLQTEDLAREEARFDALGVRNVWRSPPFDDIRAMHLHPKDVGAAIVSIDQPMPPASWRWGGPAWLGASVAAHGQPLQPGAAGRQRVLGLTLAARDPQALAQRWAQVLGCTTPLAHGPGWRVALAEGGFADVLPAAPGATGDTVAGYTLAVAEPQAVLARAQAAGLQMADSGFVLLGTQITLRPLDGPSADQPTPVSTLATAPAAMTSTAPDTSTPSSPAADSTAPAAPANGGLPDRLSVDPRSPHHVASAFERDIGVRLNGKERFDVEEYCVSEGWVRVPAGKTLDRKGKPLLIKIKGVVEVFPR